MQNHRNMESVLTTWSNSSFDSFKITCPKVFKDHDQNLKLSMDSVQGILPDGFAKFGNT